jgi:hypothetical protein
VRSDADKSFDYSRCFLSFILFLPDMISVFK